VKKVYKITPISIPLSLFVVNIALIYSRIGT